MKLLAIAGKARVGKDTIGAYLVSKGFVRYYFAKPLKDMLDVGLDLAERDFQTTEQKERVLPGIGRSYRHCAQTIGTEWGRNMIHPNLWVLIAAQRWRRLVEDHAGSDFGPAGMVITDCRFDNEARFIREAGGTVVHVQSYNGLLGMSAQAAAHPSEAGVGFVEGDRLIHNPYVEGSAETMARLHASLDSMLENLGVSG